MTESRKAVFDINGINDVKNETIKAKIQLLCSKCIDLTNGNWESKLTESVAIRSTGRKLVYWLSITGYKQLIPLDTICQLATDFHADKVFYMPAQKGVTFKFSDEPDHKKLGPVKTSSGTAKFHNLAKKLKVLQGPRLTREVHDGEMKTVRNVAAQLCADFCCGPDLTITFQSVSETFFKGNKRDISVLFTSLYPAIDCFQMSDAKFPGVVSLSCEDGGIQLAFSTATEQKRKRDEDQNEEETLNPSISLKYE